VLLQLLPIKMLFLVWHWTPLVYILLLVVMTVPFVFGLLLNAHVFMNNLLIVVNMQKQFTQLHTIRRVILSLPVAQIVSSKCFNKYILSSYIHIYIIYIYISTMYHLNIHANLCCVLFTTKGLPSYYILPPIYFTPLVCFH